MSTKKTRWRFWQRQKQPPKRLVRKGERGFGHTCAEAIYQILFPEIHADGGLDTDDKRHASNCFENGAFVFQDNKQHLFKILIGDNDTGTQTDKKYGILVGRKTTRFSSRKPLTHLIPELLKKQGPEGTWLDITFIFYEPGGSAHSVSSRAPLGEIVQYERLIHPAIKFLCNPQCRRDPLPYCHKLKRKKKPQGKGVIKFYSYSIHYRVSGRQAPYKVGPYTYVKLESLPGSSQLDESGVGAGRHKNRSIAKALLWRTQNKAATKAMRKGNCFRLSNSEYCYRAEDLGYIKAEAPESRRSYNNAHNSFPDMSTEARTAIRKYTNRSVMWGEKNREIYSLRTGQELFVPQEMTRRIIQQLKGGAPDAVRGGGGGGAAPEGRGGGGGDDGDGNADGGAGGGGVGGARHGGVHKREYIWSESSTRYGGKRRKRTRRRRKRRRTRKRRRKIRRSTKKRKRRK